MPNYAEIEREYTRLGKEGEPWLFSTVEFALHAARAQQGETDVTKKISGFKAPDGVVMPTVLELNKINATQDIRSGGILGRFGPPTKVNAFAKQIFDEVAAWRKKTGTVDGMPNFIGGIVSLESDNHYVGYVLGKQADNTYRLSYINTSAGDAVLDQQRADLIARAAQAALGVNVVAGLAPRDRILTTGVNGDCGPHTVATVLGCMNTTNDKFAALLRAQHAIPAAHPARDEAINKFSKKVRAELEPLLRFTTNSLQTHGQDQQLNRFVHETSRDPKQPNYSTPDKSKPGMGLWDILSESFLVLALVNLAGVAIAGILSVIASIYFAAKNYFVSPTPEHRDPVRRSHNPEHPEGRKVALGEYHDIAAASMPKGPLTPDAPQAQRPANCRPSVMSL